MRELTMDEMDAVSGGGNFYSSGQCQGVFTLAGGLVGASLAGGASMGFGAWAGFGGGALLGQIFGQVFCDQIVANQISSK